MIDPATEIDAFLDLVKHHLKGWVDSGLDKNGITIKPDLSNLKRVTIRAIGGVPVSATPECDDPADDSETFAPTTANFGGLWGDQGFDADDDEVTNKHGSPDAKEEPEPVVQVRKSYRGFEFI